MSNEITKPVNGFLIEPASMEEAWQYAQRLSNSQFVPAQFQSNQKNGDQTANVFFACQYGARLGFDPLLAVQNIAVVNGKPSVYGDMMLAICQASPQFEYCTESYDEKTMTWTCKCKRKSSPYATVRTFGINDAIQAHYVVMGANGEIKKQKWQNGQWVDDKFSPWVTNPKRMLQMRARSFALRDTFASELKGMACREEVIDIVPEAELSGAPAVQAIQVDPQQAKPTKRAEQIKAKVKKSKPVQVEEVEPVQVQEEPQTTNELPMLTDSQEADIIADMRASADINELNRAVSALNEVRYTQEQDARMRAAYNDILQLMQQRQ